MLVLAALAVALGGAANPAHAQNRARVTIDFPFFAGRTAMQAGAYDIDASQNQVMIRSASVKGQSVAVTVITRLGRHDNDADPELVFDKLEGKFYLSEVWFPDRDGFLVLNTPADHEHRVLGGSRPSK